MSHCLDLPVVLASSGRLEEAKVEIAEVLKSHRPLAKDTYWQQGIQKFTAWLDSGAVLPDPPPAPKHQEPFVPPQIQVGDIWNEAKDLTAKRRSAVEAVRELSGARSRDELRAMLADELEARGLAVNPREVEVMLDGIQANTPADKRQLRRDGLRTLADVGRGIAHALRDRGRAEPVVPDVARLPDDSAYPIPIDARRWLRVLLDRDAESLFQQVAATASPAIDGSIKVEVWLAQEEGTVTVHVGTERVGSLKPQEGVTYVDHVHAAERLGLRAVAPGRITSRRLAPQHLLEIAAPAPP